MPCTWPHTCHVRARATHAPCTCHTRATHVPYACTCATHAMHVPQAGRAELCAVAAALSEPLCAQECAYTQYVRNCLASHRAEDFMALVEAAPNDIARRFKNLHHKLSH